MTDELLFPGCGAVVVGGSRGVGAAVAALLAAEGAGVVVNGRDQAVTEQTAADIRLRGGHAVAVGGSAAEESVAHQLRDTCVRQYGSVDVLVNCAGIAEPAGSSILTITAGDWRSLLDSHLETTYMTCRSIAPLMAERGRGAIVNTSSFAYLGDYGGTGYPAGKGAVTSLTLALAAELKEFGVRANVVCPGAKTRLSSGADYESHIAELHRRGLLDQPTMQASLNAAPPEYAASIYAYLASDLAKDITGDVFVAAGGFVGQLPRPTLSVLAYRDSEATPPWSPIELHRALSSASRSEGS